MSGPVVASDKTGAILRLLDRPVSAADLDGAAELAARTAEARGARTTGLLLFKVGDETAAVGARLLQRITRFARPRPIPRISAGIFRGLCNIRGELVLCADLHRLLGLPERAVKEKAGDEADPRRMVVIGSREEPWAFEVDSVIGVERIDPALVRPAPVTVAYAMGAFTSGVTEIEGRQVTMLDGERILAGFKAGLA
jgi:chemotaxis signal transduction protein